MTTFNTNDLFKKTTREIETTLLSETELDVVIGGSMTNPKPLPPHSGPTDPRQF